ncbi:MAG: hypothetical protein REI12_13495 [Pedobacter sp.]|nr:hypothetical protein [Pedobacter sp.]
MKLLTRLSIPVAMAGLLAGCGSGEETATGKSATTTGVFRDAPVVGLRVEGSTGKQLTASDGSFAYRPGETYTFYVGKVVLGSFTPTTDNVTVSPASLVPSRDKTSIINLTRFLITLDAETVANPVNGITILPAMDTDAQSWTIVGFDPKNLSNSAATAVLNGLSSGGSLVFNGINAINGRTAGTAYYSAANAESHLNNSMNCAYTGAYYGERKSGSSLESRVALVVDYQGKVSTRQFFPLGLSNYTFTKASGFSYTNLLTDDTVKTEVAADGSPAVPAWLRYQFKLADADRVWVNTTLTPGAGGVTGSYTGDDQAFSRLSGKPTALYRFAGLVSTVVGAVPINDLVYLVEVDAGSATTKTVSGRLLDLRTGNAAAISGTYTAAGLITANATLDNRTVQLLGQLSGNTWSANFKDANNGIDQAAVTEGCKLN